MRERDYFGEKMTDLDFRIDARLEAAKELDDVSADGLHMNDWSYACLAKVLGMAIADAAPRSR